MSVNKVILLGNATQDPRVTTFETGKVIQIGLATNQKGFTTKDGREVPDRTEFHNLVVRRNGLVDVFEKYVRKGNKLYIEGELHTRAYQQDGVEKYITEIYVNEVELLTPKPQGAPAPSPIDAPQSTFNQDDEPF